MVSTSPYFTYSLSEVQKPVLEQAAKRFWSKVSKINGGCWLWTGSCHGANYGKFTFLGRHISAHRFAYELEVGDIPKDLTIDHLCYNPQCVNPEPYGACYKIREYQTGSKE